MIDALPPYPKMRDSGVAWLGAVPAHWVVRRAKYVLREIDQRSEDGSEDLLRVSQYTGVTKRGKVGDSEESDTRAVSLVGYKCVWKDDLAVNIMLAWNGSLGVSPYDGIVSPAYCVYRLGETALPAYFHQLFRTNLFKDRFKVASRGVVDSRLRLYTDDLYRVETLLPPLDEQAAIVRFLADVDRRIGGYVAAKLKLVKLLEEAKAAIVHRAVTRGLNPAAPMTPSGVPWLGDIPAHWELAPTRAFLRYTKEFVGSFSNNYTLLSLTKGGVVIRDLEKSKGKFPGSFDTYQPIESGDFIFCLFDIDETPRAVGWSKVNGMITGAYSRFICLQPEYAQFLAAYFHAMDDQKAFKPIYSGLRKVISRSSFLSAKVPVPPKDECAAICLAIATQTKHLDAAISTARAEIDLLREYRTRLIADVVTGKRDVRAAAASLPEIVDHAPLPDALTDDAGEAEEPVDDMEEA